MGKQFRLKLSHPIPTAPPPLWPRGPRARIRCSPGGHRPARYGPVGHKAISPARLRRGATSRGATSRGRHLAGRPLAGRLLRGPPRGPRLRRGAPVRRRRPSGAEDGRDRRVPARQLPSRTRGARLGPRRAVPGAAMIGSRPTIFRRVPVPCSRKRAGRRRLRRASQIRSGRRLAAGVSSRTAHLRPPRPGLPTDRLATGRRSPGPAAAPSGAAHRTAPPACRRAPRSAPPTR